MLNANDYIGTMFADRYKILREIGHGASSIVFCAQDVLKGCKVAVKILDKDSNEYMLNSKSFQTEIEALVEMNSHPNIVEIYDASFEGSVHYISMEYVEGCTLRRYMDANGVLPENKIIDIACQVLDALKAAHSAGVIHRDIKPQNILVEETAEGDTPQIKLADFGIARLPEGDRFVMKDRGVGTVHYISPEQASGGEVTAKSDMYSLGVVMYEMATGHVPFDAEKVTAIISKHQTDLPEPPQLHNPALSPGLQMVIMKAMSKDPARRFRSADDMMRALLRVKENGDYGVSDSGKSVAEKPAKQKTARPPKPKKEKKPGYQAPKKAKAPKDMRFLKPTLIALTSTLLVAAIAVGAVIFIPKWLHGDNSGIEEPEIRNFSNMSEFEGYEDAGIVKLGRKTEVYSDRTAGTVLRQELVSTDENGVQTYDLWVSIGGTAWVRLDRLYCGSFDALSAYLKETYPLDYEKVALVSESAGQYDSEYPVGSVLKLVFTYKDGVQSGFAGHPSEIAVDENLNVKVLDLVKITAILNPEAPTP